MHDFDGVQRVRYESERISRTVWTMLVSPLRSTRRIGCAFIDTSEHKGGIKLL